ncbi:MAG: IS481 family transposase [Desulfobacterales bacterium]|nr:IS481 family transposase [Desulfobacterales bacterium]
MPWLTVRPMDAKILFLGDWLRGFESFSALCRRHGISRKTGYKWVQRYRAQGPDGLQDRSRRPHHNPQAIAFTVKQSIIDLRKRHPGWGPKKLLSLLAREHPDWDLPSKTSIYNILRAEGLIQPARRRRRVVPTAKPFAPAHVPNDVWSADFKGQFFTQDGVCCYPLTVMDHVSRYLLSCQIVKGTRAHDSQQVFKALFSQYGLPKRIRTDNGAPFASIGVGGLSKLSVWWVRLGIMPERIAPGKPQQNGRHERMHRTLKQETLQPPAATAQAQQRCFDHFRQRYNELRPHESLKQCPPASCYSPSQRRMPSHLPPVSYPGHFRQARVNPNGTIWLNGVNVYIGYLLKGETIGLEQLDNELWEVSFGRMRICRINKNKKESSTMINYR